MDNSGRAKYLRFIGYSIIVCFAIMFLIEAIEGAIGFVFFDNFGYVLLYVLELILFGVFGPSLDISLQSQIY